MAPNFLTKGNETKVRRVQELNQKIKNLQLLIWGFKGLEKLTDFGNILGLGEVSKVARARASSVELGPPLSHCGLALFLSRNPLLSRLRLLVLYWPR